ncbi:MAG: sn-glycerol-3-phosphate ABC transporter ATP-binding protein UgpC [Mesorhizobium sp.]|uniref:ABC transporter ATP-binding protein n=1 Tax=unclassified Mesorhizobium TaxID=325217 RepID=UPI000FC9C765|nr:MULTISPECIES: sn-glycerol-3-phosphate ABC transporter ATP-binding protein UgpC [unclassified Mesorhizobium]RUV71449.1 sn-glycerol-3-phosphate ABC transporter ATP-binding protein UgpC [Mesorhizobium sp. M5C.F.Cr.IN.023.01.1.1]RWF86896.1 MAG: sn-glycerol-3-phosphate ABC transporter ATP-binding protein UgpC [Mesorhizobium sp.]RWF94665.1 MAG: sn-glycerol-3-phosphate ABC transporter ATP-binding protein UgpC [Mesorhizobium sp.]RWI41439.1 MAG: sn-glycerol-3-phosphate ABC transporter ATP-binding pro
MAELKLRGARKSYGSVEIIKGLDLDVEDREFVVFVGPSGCGKSTLLRMIAGLEKITAGDLLIDGLRANDIDPSERGLAMVFQSYGLYPHMTVAENMGFALKIAGVSAAEKERKVREAAEVLQLSHLLDRRPKALSGGQRQRVAIGRAIVRNPKVFLFDEPLSNLDAALRVSMRLELMRLHEHLAATMIYVTHDQTEAMTMADKIVVLNGGSIEQVGSPLELYNRPANIFVAGFIGSPKMNLLKLKVASTGPEGVTVTLPDGQALTVPVAAGASKSGDELLLGMRPEHLRISANGQFKGRAVLAERLGSLTILHVEIAPDITLVVQAEGGDRTPLHSLIALDISPALCHLFRMDGPALAPLQPG